MERVITQDKRNIIKTPIPRKIFVVFDYLILTALFAICAFPFLNILAVSLSHRNAVHAVTVFPIGFNISAYQFLIEGTGFFRAFGMSVLRAGLGTPLALVVMILMAYPISLKGKVFFGKKFYVGLCITAMFFSGGLIPTFVVITRLGMRDTLWALILPSAMNVWSMILLLNFFRRVPDDLTEYASIEGAGHFRKLIYIILPLSVPAIATVSILTAIFHWNAWFDGFIYMSQPNFPLQTYIYEILDTLRLIQTGQMQATPELLARVDNQTLRAAQVFIAMVPIMLVYPIAQRFFVKGMMLGSVKE